MKELKVLVKDIERDLVIYLSIFTKYERISFQESKKMAWEYYKLYPFLDYEDLFRSLHKLSVKYKVFRRVYVKYAPVYYDEKARLILDHARNEMLAKRINKAVKLMKSINYE